jgi:protein-S-isoprenylcysteine O-methyltransferase Ste14
MRRPTPEDAVRRTWAVLGTLLFFILALGTVALLVPWLLTGGRTAPPFLGSEATLALGATLLAAGLIALVDCYTRFAWEGLGTPSPVFPTTHLIVRGLYVFVRNPIYLAVVSIILGEALLLASPAMLLYAVLAAVLCHLIVRFYEEPALKRRYGESYEAYCASTPRWLPRLRAARAGEPT